MAKKMHSVSKLKLGSAAVAAVAGLVGNSRSADASIVLTLSEPGFAPLVMTAPTSTGLVRITQAYGSFDTNFDFGLTNEVSSSSPFAYLQIQSFEVDNAVGTNGSAPSFATLTVDLQVTDAFTFPGDPTSLVLLNSSAGGTLTPSTPGDAITFQSFAFPDAGGTVTTGQIPAAIQAGGGTVNVPLTTAYFTRGTGFTLENTLNFALNPNEVASINGSTNVSLPTGPVPEPTSAAFLAGAALLGIRRRRA
jgi:hypothetical protein